MGREAEIGALATQGDLGTEGLVIRVGWTLDVLKLEFKEGVPFSTLEQAWKETEDILYPEEVTLNEKNRWASKWTGIGVGLGCFRRVVTWDLDVGLRRKPKLGFRKGRA